MIYEYRVGEVQKRAKAADDAEKERLRRQEMRKNEERQVLAFELSRDI